MLKIINYFLLIFVLVFAHQVKAAPLNGNAVALESTPISGGIDIASNTMSVNDWLFLGDVFTTTDIELLQPGSYTRVSGNVTVPVGHVGAHMEFNWNANVFYSFMVWDVSVDAATYTIIDSDGDGAPGHTFTNGPFSGITLYYEFETTPTGTPEPNIKLILSVDGGNVQECTGDSAADVTVNAVASLIGGAALDLISWTIDGNDAGTGASISESLSLGDHVIEATGITTTGESDVKSIIVTVSDTTRPVVHLVFLDKHGNEVESSRRGKFTVSFDVTDFCDPDPVITSSTATPTSTVSNGDRLHINPRHGIKLPVTAVRVTVTAQDASENNSFITSKSIIFESKNGN